MDRQELDSLINIEDNLIPAEKHNRPGDKIRPTYITIHNTGNSTTGADARAHAKYLNKTGYYVHNGKKIWTSWHFTVDDERAVRHLPLNELAYHAHSRANGSSLAIEICMDNGSDQDAANLRAARLVAALMYDLALPISRVRTHHDWTGKACPELLLDDGRPGRTWDAFKETVLSQYRGIEPAKEFPAEDRAADDVRENAQVPIDPDEDNRCHVVLPVTRSVDRSASTVAIAPARDSAPLATVLAVSAIGLGIAALWLLGRRAEEPSDVEWLPPFEGPLERDGDFSEMTRGPRWTPSDIAKQVQRVRSEGWDRHFSEAASAYGFPKALLMGIASRETNVRNITGDGGHGRGIMQIDDRYHAGNWTDPRRNIMKGAEILASARDAIARAEGARQVCRKRPYVGSRLDDAELLRTAVAAYNSGCAAYYWMSTSGDPDRGTTGKDYSKDTLARAAEFSRHL